MSIKLVIISKAPIQKLPNLIFEELWTPNIHDTSTIFFAWHVPTGANMCKVFQA
jgi:hypothetical protein